MKKITLDFGVNFEKHVIKEVGSFQELKEKYQEGNIFQASEHCYFEIQDAVIEPFTDFWPKNSHEPKKAYKGKLTYLILKNMVECYDFFAALQKESDPGFYMVYWNDYEQKFNLSYAPSGVMIKPPVMASKGVIRLGLIYKDTESNLAVKKSNKIVKPDIEYYKHFIKRYHTDEF